MINDPQFDQLLREALAIDFFGWDFSVIGERWTTTPLPWDYLTLVKARLPGVRSLLDLGTGGGELLASLGPLPPETWATEGYAPNVPVARQRLDPLGVQVVSDYADEALPFPNNCLDLVINRHESFDAREVFRVLKPGAYFITQQVGGQDNFRLNELLQDKPEFEFSFWTLDYITRLLRAAGFEVTRAEEYFPENTFRDIAMVAFYLRIIEWQIAGFEVTAYYEKLYRLHQMIQRDGGLVTHCHRIIIEARKP